MFITLSTIVSAWLESIITYFWGTSAWDTLEAWWLTIVEVLQNIFTFSFSGSGPTPV